MLRLIACTLVPLALVAGSARAGGGESLPGVVTGAPGAVDAAAGVRYLARPAGGSTRVVAVRARDGRVLRRTTVPGSFGIARVAFDGTTEGVSFDGTTLVLADARRGAATSRFAVLDTAPLRLRKTIELEGVWAYDALSPDGRILYAIRYALGVADGPRYTVRAVSLLTGRELGGVIVDKTNPTAVMTGSPWSRVLGVDGAWAYTLYAKARGTGFVHALDTLQQRAVCIELPWRSATLMRVRLSLANAGRTLVLSRGRDGRIATIDTSTFRLRILKPGLP